MILDGGKSFNGFELVGTDGINLKGVPIKKYQSVEKYNYGGYSAPLRETGGAKLRIHNILHPYAVKTRY